jgi:glycosyltransferase involved in cell wall biosynthesis
MSEVTAIVISPPNYKIRAEVLNAIRRQCKKIIIVSGRQRAVQRNMGLKKAETKYVLMVDTDEVIAPNYVEKLMLSMKNNVGACCGIHLPAPNLSKLAKLAEYFNCIVKFQTKMPSPGLLNRELALRVGGYRVVRGEISDFPIDLLWRLRASGYNVVFKPNAIKYHLHNYTIRELIKGGTTLKYDPLSRSFLRMFSAQIRIIQHFSKVYALCHDKLMLLLPVYAFFYQSSGFIRGLVMRGLR